MTVDIISEYAFGQPFGLTGQVQTHKFDVPFLRAFDLVLHGVVDFTYFPLFRRLFNLLPNWLPPLLDEAMGQMLELYGVRCEKTPISSAYAYSFSPSIELGSGSKPRTSRASNSHGHPYSNLFLGSLMI
jgi:hypothetical protein